MLEELLFSMGTMSDSRKLFSRRSALVLVLIVLAVAALTLGIYFYVFSSAPALGAPRASISYRGLELDVDMSATELQPKTMATITVSLRNTSNETVDLTFANWIFNPDTAIFDLIVADLQNRTVYRWNAGYAMGAAFHNHTLHAGQQIVNLCRWNQTTGHPYHKPVSGGYYSLRALVQPAILKVRDQSELTNLATPTVFFVIR